MPISRIGRTPLGVAYRSKLGALTRPGGTFWFVVPALIQIDAIGYRGGRGAGGQFDPLFNKVVESFKIEYYSVFGEAVDLGIDPGGNPVGDHQFWRWEAPAGNFLGDMHWRWFESQANALGGTDTFTWLHIPDARVGFVAGNPSADIAVQNYAVNTAWTPSERTFLRYTVGAPSTPDLDPTSETLSVTGKLDTAHADVDGGSANYMRWKQWDDFHKKLKERYGFDTETDEGARKEAINLPPDYPYLSTVPLSLLSPDDTFIEDQESRTGHTWLQPFNLGQNYENGVRFPWSALLGYDKHRTMDANDPESQDMVQFDTGFVTASDAVDSLNQHVPDRTSRASVFYVVDATQDAGMPRLGEVLSVIGRRYSEYNLYLVMTTDCSNQNDSDAVEAVLLEHASNYDQVEYFGRIKSENLASELHRFTSILDLFVR